MGLIFFLHEPKWVPFAVRIGVRALNVEAQWYCAQWPLRWGLSLKHRSLLHPAATPSDEAGPLGHAPCALWVMRLLSWARNHGKKNCNCCPILCLEKQNFFINLQFWKNTKSTKLFTGKMPTCFPSFVLKMWLEMLRKFMRFMRLNCYISFRFMSSLAGQYLYQIMFCPALLCFFTVNLKCLDTNCNEK